MTKKGPSRKTRKLNSPKNLPSGSSNIPAASQSTLKHDRFIDIPLEILCEIFKFLTPLDLLHLAWTSKSFRKFLMNRVSKSVWAHVLSTVEGLPSCADDLSEPQYVYLMFSTNCHKHELNYAGLVVLNKRMEEDERTRFHVNTAMALYADYNKQANGKGAQAESLWMNEQKKLWLAKEEHSNACEKYFNLVERKELERAEKLKKERREQREQ
ncbi:hypothetical protein EST38_g3133 [Candolleomyces aberdarensis]|uniref:F-box domain-containing protein n=1 Tax=Candolleomyces aberdarensis TaxID=2316362 RepID=A0A4Q2DQM4_9AGAR|nr:hypothetical protein EST38_g3133 [Candolleomyces aberdarensis]